jgi:superfamily II DNA/RNA helicase
MIKLGGIPSLQSVTLLILDEADKLLNVSLIEQVTKICSLVRPDKQTLLFSATFSDLSIIKSSPWITSNEDIFFLKIGTRYYSYTFLVLY